MSVPGAELAKLEQSLRRACLAGDAPVAYDSLQRWLAIGQSDVARPLVIGSGEACTVAVEFGGSNSDTTHTLSVYP